MCLASRTGWVTAGRETPTRVIAAGEVAADAGEDTTNIAAKAARAAKTRTGQRLVDAGGLAVRVTAGVWQARRLVPGQRHYLWDVPVLATQGGVHQSSSGLQADTSISLRRVSLTTR